MAKNFRTVVVCMLFLAGFVGEAFGFESRRTLVVGNPVKIDFLMLEHDKKGQPNSNAIYVGVVYRVKIKVKKVLFGELNAGDIIDVELITTAKYSIANPKLWPLFLVIETDETGNISVVNNTWGHLTNLACVGQAIIESTSFGESRLPKNGNYDMYIKIGDKYCFYVSSD